MSMNWGMANRLARIIKPEDGRAVMLAVDHGYFLGPTSGLEEPRKTIEPLLPHADSIMLTRGVLRTSVDPKADKPIVLTCLRRHQYPERTFQRGHHGVHR